MTNRTTKTGSSTGSKAAGSGYSGAIGVPTTSNAGLITSATTAARQLQFGLKIGF